MIRRKTTILPTNQPAMVITPEIVDSVNAHIFGKKRSFLNNWEIPRLKNEDNIEK